MNKVKNFVSVCDRVRTMMSFSRSLFLVLLALVAQFSCDANSYVDQIGDDFLSGKELLEYRNQLTRALEDPAVMKDLFADFIEDYNKVYLTPAEKSRRFEIFSNNVEKYNELNQNDMGTAVYGIDQFADMTDDEFRDKMLTLDAAAAAKKRSLNKIYDGPELSKKKMPKNFDWRSKNAVSAVKDQGYCGSCWAFSAVGNMEGLWAIKHKKQELFSEQQIVDCDTESWGCRGGWMVNAFNYVKKANGLEKSETYPYRGSSDGTCSFNKSAAVLKVKSVVELPRDERKIARYSYLNGPSSAALDASAMRGYRGGIAHPPEGFCSKNETQVNHGITIVGYGVAKIELQGKKKNLPYWIIKNSWGLKFGQKGYYYLYRGDGSCAIHTYVSSATLA